VYTIAIDSQDNIYIGGNFTNWAADGNADYWAWWNGASWAAVDDIALNGIVWSMEVNEQDELFVGGAFTGADSVSGANKIIKWTGTAVEALGAGAGASIRCMTITPDGMLWVGGSFSTIGTFTDADRIAVWNGASWILPDVNLSGTPILYGMDSGNPDPVVPANYDVFIGCDTSGTAYFAGDATAANDGTAAQYPIIVIERNGGTSARLVSVRNWTTGQELFCDYDLLDGERIIIDCRPKQKTITSTFFGNRPKAILPNSDFGGFRLQPGNNAITAFVDVAGDPTMTKYMVWRDAYRGMD
jgi:hypothetical protein